MKKRRKIREWIKRNWKKVLKWLKNIVIIIGSVFAAVLVMKGAKRIIEAVRGKVEGRSDTFTLIPGEKHTILVKKDGVWQRVSLEQIGVNSKDVKSVHYQDGERPIVEVKHEAKDRRNINHIDNNALDNFNRSSTE